MVLTRGCDANIAKILLLLVFLKQHYCKYFFKRIVFMKYKVTHRPQYCYRISGTDTWQLLHDDYQPVCWLLLSALHRHTPANQAIYAQRQCSGLQLTRRPCAQLWLEVHNEPTYTWNPAIDQWKIVRAGQNHFQVKLPQKGNHTAMKELHKMGHFIFALHQGVTPNVGVTPNFA